MFLTDLFLLFGIDDIAIATVVGAVISSVVSFAGSAYNAHKQEDLNDEIIDNNNENLQRSEALQREQWQREDSALQRKVIDAQKAGLSPLAALGANGSASTPINYTGQIGQVQAPQMDFGSITSMLSSLNSDMVNMRGQDVAAETADKAQKAETERNLKTCNTNIRIAKMNAVNAKNIADQDFRAKVISINADIDKANQNTAYLYDLMGSGDANKDYDRLMSSVSKVNDTRLNLSSELGFSPRIEYYDDWSKFLDAQKAQNDNWTKADEEQMTFFSTLSPEEQSNFYSTAHSEGKNKSLSGQLGFGKGKGDNASRSESYGKGNPILKSFTDAAGSFLNWNFNAGGSYGDGSMTSDSTSMDRSMQQKRTAASFYVQNKCAICVYRGSAPKSRNYRKINHY